MIKCMKYFNKQLQIESARKKQKFQRGIKRESEHLKIKYKENFSGEAQQQNGGDRGNINQLENKIG